MSRKNSAYGPKHPLTSLNRRQEQFCAYVVAGYTYEAAYVAAGYDVGANGGRTFIGADGRKTAAAFLGAKLARNPFVKKRIEALQIEQSERNEVMRNELAERWRIDVEKTTIMLLEDRHFARTGQLSLPDENGKRAADSGDPPPDWRPDPRAAVQATMGLAKLHGLLVDRKEVTVIDAMQNMNNIELMGFIAKLQAQLGPVIDVPVTESPPRGEPSGREPSNTEPPRLSRRVNHDDVIREGPARFKKTLAALMEESDEYEDDAF